MPTLRSAYPELTKAEKVIANYISEHANDIMSQTISVIATGIGNSEINVSRFCKKLGFQGLQSLNIALAVDINRDIAIKFFQNIMDGLQDTLKILDFNAVDSLIQARRVDIYCFRNSATICRDIETRFLRFGMMVHAYSDAHMQVTSASLLNEKDVVIAVY